MEFIIRVIVTGPGPTPLRPLGFVLSLSVRISWTLPLNDLVISVSLFLVQSKILHKEVWNVKLNHLYGFTEDRTIKFKGKSRRLVFLRAFS